MRKTNQKNLVLQIMNRYILIRVKDISIEGLKAEATVVIRFSGNGFSGIHNQRHLLVKKNDQWLIEQLN